ncbi:MAG: hypothetical protein ACRDF4_10655 [Rhabdochlamydiaceae bacterium]
MAELSPYTKDTLFSYPGDGSTECLGNCTCTLVRHDGVRGFGRAKDLWGGEGDGDADEKGQSLDPVKVSGNLITKNPAEDALPEEVFKLSDSVAVHPNIQKLASDVLGEIDKIIRVPASSQPPIAISNMRMQEGSFGVCITSLNRSDTPIKIHVDTKQLVAQNPSTLVHEIGHALDSKYFSGALANEQDFASWLGAHGKGKMQGIFESIYRSKMVKSLEDAARSSEYRPQISRFIKGYYLSPQELWARCFTQFICSRVINKSLQDAWKSCSQEVVNKDECAIRVHWDDDDFEEIDKEVTQFLKEVGFEV